MTAALKKHVVPILKERGFTGKFPNFRRMNDTGIDLLTFQFDKWGGGFVVNIAACPKEGTTTYWGETFGPDVVTAHHINYRLRLGATDEESDHWFRYDKKGFGFLFSRRDPFEAAALEVLPYLDSQAENWWRKHRS